MCRCPKYEVILFRSPSTLSYNKIDFQRDEDDEEESCIATPLEIFKTEEDSKFNLLSSKSKKVYENAYDEFVKWCNNRKESNYTENVFLAYFSEKSEFRKPSSLWSHYSMLKATVNLHHNIDISKYSKLITFLKRRSDGYKPKKSKILSRNDIERFLKEAPDDLYLMIKVSHSYFLINTPNTDRIFLNRWL